MDSHIKISAVIATFNRRESLFRLLKSLDKQDFKIKEVIIVDASDKKIENSELNQIFPKLHLRYFTSKPSVCAQRNIGIKKTTGTHIFICDDDMELPENYISFLAHYLSHNPNVGAVSGTILQKDKNDQWSKHFDRASALSLLWSFVFLTSVWMDLSFLKETGVKFLILKLLKKYYSKKGNSITAAGWPLLTNYNSPVFTTEIYGLGASLIRQDWLKNNLYDEKLDQFGIGDNYGVAINFPAEQAIHVLAEVSAFHYKTEQNRLEYSEIYFRRIMALHYFLDSNKRFTKWNKLSFLWSLIGNFLLFSNQNKMEMAKKTKDAMFTILAGKNPILNKFEKK